VDSNAEVTLETNPGTLYKEKLKNFKEIGINRLSIGIQSFNNDELKFLTRIHDAETAIKTVSDAKEAGFRNVSIDLIFNLPGQTKDKWITNLDKAVNLPVQHISAYSLLLERGTILNKMVLDGKVELQDEDHDADLYETTIDYLTQNGFHQYEVSNFSKAGFNSLHNSSYWNYKEYLGFGTSAHSFVDGKRWWNYSSLRKYLVEMKNRNAIAGSEKLTKAQMHDEYVMLALRGEGIDLEDYNYRFNNGWIKENYSYFQKLKYGKLINMKENKINLTRNGYILCDEILRNIL
jgi:oxygen-independent coproporphyrinogen-3 oxidase